MASDPDDIDEPVADVLVRAASSALPTIVYSAAAIPELTRQVTRLGDLFEVYLRRVCGIDPSATDADMKQPELERVDETPPWQEEWMATIEELEEAGVVVPASAYKKIGLEPPQREDEPVANADEAE